MATQSSAQYTQNDAANCGPQTNDPNGGCNLASPLFQDLGSHATGEFLTVTGTIGTYIPTGGTTYTSRDLDWFTITLTQDSVVSITLTTTAAQNVLFIGDGGTCPAALWYGVQAATPQSSGTQYLAAGTYTIVATTPFETDAVNPVYACGNYTLSIDIQPGNSSCGSATTQPCDVAHATGGCDDWSCCNVVCSADPLCCDLQWDANCVTNGAVALCGYFIYTCPPAAGAPVNNCVTAATQIAVGETKTFDTTNSTTDGPSPVATGAAAWMGKDIWYVIQAPANGQLTLDSCASSYDQCMELYALGTSSSVTDPSTLPSLFIGQVDDSCGVTGGPATLTLVDAVQGEWYLLRVGGWAADAVSAPAVGAGSVTASFQQVIFSSGNQNTVTVVADGSNVNLGLSSGAISATSKQRWLAMPFTAPAGDVTWAVEQIIAKGFIPAGSTDTNLEYVIWKRNANNPAPVAADQVAAGSVPFPAFYDDALDDAATAAAAIDVNPPVTINPGNYYLTVFASDPNDSAHGNGSTISNFAWFIYAKDGINLFNSGGAPMAWRSVTFPTPGFVVYTGLTGVYIVKAGDDQNDIYTTSFTILGSSTPTAPECPADLDDNGTVNAADLAILLGAWGGSGGDIDGNGTTNASDLALLLGAWGACP